MAEQNQTPTDTTPEGGDSLATYNEAVSFDEITSLSEILESKEPDNPEDTTPPLESTIEDDNENIQVANVDHRDIREPAIVQEGPIDDEGIEIPSREPVGTEPPPEQPGTTEGMQAPIPPVDFPIPEGGGEFPPEPTPPGSDFDSVEFPVVEPEPVVVA